MARIISDKPLEYIHPDLNSAEGLILDVLSRLPGDYAVITPDAVKWSYFGKETTGERVFVLLHLSGSMLLIYPSGLKSAEFRSNAWHAGEDAPAGADKAISKAEKHLKTIRDSFASKLSGSNAEKNLLAERIHMCIWFPFADSIDYAENHTAGIRLLCGAEYAGISKYIDEHTRKRANSYPLFLSRWNALASAICLEGAAESNKAFEQYVDKLKRFRASSLDNFTGTKSFAVCGGDDSGREEFAAALIGSMEHPLLVSRGEPSFDRGSALVCSMEQALDAAEKCDILVWNAGDYTPDDLRKLKDKPDRGIFAVFYSAGSPAARWADGCEDLCHLTFAEPLACNRSILRTANSLYPADRELLWNTEEGQKPKLHLLTRAVTGALSADDKRAAEYRIVEILQKHKYATGDSAAVVRMSMSGQAAGGGMSFMYRSQENGEETRIPVISPDAKDRYECVILTDVRPEHFEGESPLLSRATLRGLRFVHMIMLLTEAEQKELFAKYGGSPGAFRGAMEEQYGIQTYTSSGWLKDNDLINSAGIIYGDFKKGDAALAEKILDLRNEPGGELTVFVLNPRREALIEKLKKHGISAIAWKDIEDRLEKGGQLKHVAITDFSPVTLQKPENGHILFSLFRRAYKAFLLSDRQHKRELDALWEPEGAER
ncbi:MAG: hypothetical protein IK083_10100 [Abditibacteriota bacterium]|nr:hypothetical protein [Abditibacteriota bacterium]